MKNLQDLKNIVITKRDNYNHSNDSNETRLYEKWNDRIWEIEFELAKNLSNNLDIEKEC